MRLLEYESKEIFRKYGLPVLKSILITPPDNILEKIAGFTFPLYVKAQVPVGSRKKRGLIKSVVNAKEVQDLCHEYFVKGYEDIPINAVLVEESAKVEKEYYVSIAIDTFNRQFVFIASKEGGIDIESVSKENPDAIFKQPIAIDVGIGDEIPGQVATRIGIPDYLRDDAVKIFKDMWEITKNYDAELVEINPLAITSSRLYALDGKMIVDDNAFFRRPEIEALIQKKSTALEKIAAENTFSFVKMDGNIGILANGAGLTLSLLDILSQYGLDPANFLDVGGGAGVERVTKALELIFRLKPRGVLINIFGGITRCDIVAQGIIQALKLFKKVPPVAIRLSGTNEKEGAVILNNAGLKPFSSLMQAIQFLKEEIQKQGSDA